MIRYLFEIGFDDLKGDFLVASIFVDFFLAGFEWRNPTGGAMLAFFLNVRDKSKKASYVDWKLRNLHMVGNTPCLIQGFHRS